MTTRPRRRAGPFFAAVLVAFGLALIPGGTPARAKTELSVEVGFQGRFVADRLTRVRVQIRHDGPSLEGELVLRQLSQGPLTGALAVEARRPVRLAPGAHPLYEFYLPLSSHTGPGGDEPVLHVELRARGRVVAQEDVPLAEGMRFRPLVLLIGEGSYPRLLPTGERVEELHPEELPGDWRAYGGVERVYLGRVAPGRLLPEQKRALEQWLLAGGELLVLGGENFLLQDDAWLRALLPMAVDGVRFVEALGRVAAVGEPQGEVLYQVGEHPLVLRRSWGLGTVYFSALDLRGESRLEAEAWRALAPLRTGDGRANSAEPFLNSELFPQAKVLLPALGVYGTLLTLYLAGLAGLALGLLRRLETRLGAPRWEEAAASEGTVRLRGPTGGRGWRPLLLLLGWLGICSGALGAYLERPAFTQSAQSLEVGFLVGGDEAPGMVREIWYSALFRRPNALAVPVEPEAWVYPTPPASSPSLPDRRKLVLSTSPRGLRVLLVPPIPEGQPQGAGRSWTVAGFYRREVLPQRVEVRVRTEGVRNPIARVYNGTQWHLRRATLWHEGIAYELGDLPPQTSLEAELTPQAQPRMVSSGSGSFADRVRVRLYQEARKRYALEEGAWTLLAWIEGEGLQREASEYRQSYILVIVPAAVGPQARSGE